MSSLRISRSGKPKVNPSDIEFRRLGDDCKTEAFICGFTHIEGWFQHMSRTYHSRFYSRVTTAHFRGNAHPAGFYSCKLQREAQYEFVGKTFLQDKVFTDREYMTTLHLEWFAVSTEMQGIGLGDLMMGKFVDDAYQIINRVGINAVTMKYMDNKSKALYSSFEFEPYGRDGDCKLFISAEEIMALYQGDEP